MALSEQFVLRVSEIAHNRKALIDLMNQLDEEKRAIRSNQRKWSNDTKDNGGLHGVERTRRLRKTKDRISFLIEEREYVRKKLADFKGDQKALKRALTKKAEFTHAFFAAAERLLDEEMFTELEIKAAQIMMQES